MLMHPVPRDSPTTSSVLGSKSHDINRAPSSPHWRPLLVPSHHSLGFFPLVAGVEKKATGATGRLGLDGLMRTEVVLLSAIGLAGRLEEGNGAWRMGEGRGGEGGVIVGFPPWPRNLFWGSARPI